MIGCHCRYKSTVLESILHLPRHKKTDREMEQEAMELLEIVGLADYRYEYANSLAYGLQRRLEIARALATRPRILLLDEPAAGMNEKETQELTEFIREVRGMGHTIILIEHDVRLVMGLCDYVNVLDHGALIASGVADEVQKNPLVIEAYLGKGVEE